MCYGGIIGLSADILSLKGCVPYEKRAAYQKGEPPDRADDTGKQDETDPFGSYTGKPIDPFEEPEQDADDL